MLFNRECLDKYDSSEDCVVAKLLVGLIFNPFVPANCQENYGLAREFLRYYLDDRVDHLDLSTAEVLLKPRFSWFNTSTMQAKDRTAPDLFLLIPNECMIAFEVKYTLPIQAPNPPRLPHQLLREYDHLQSLHIPDVHVKERYVFLLMTQQRLFSHVRRGTSDRGIQILRECIRQCGDNFRVNTWNCVDRALSGTSDEYLPDKTALLSFIRGKRNYMTNSLNGSKQNMVRLVADGDTECLVYTWRQLEDMIVKGQVRADTGPQSHVTEAGDSDLRKIGEVDDSEPHVLGLDPASIAAAEKPLWRCIGDRFDLQALNHERIDVSKLRILFQRVEKGTSGRQKISNHFREEFQQWLNDPSRPLVELAYALLSNWFLTGKENSRGSQLAESARALWNELFCCEPKARLTSPESGQNHKILPERFRLWWPKQEACQNSRLTHVDDEDSNH